MDSIDAVILQLAAETITVLDLSNQGIGLDLTNPRADGRPVARP